MLAVLIVVFLLCLILLKAFVFPKLTTNNIIIMTSILVILILLAYDPTTKRLRENYEEDTSKIRFLGGLLKQDAITNVTQRFNNELNSYNETNIPNFDKSLQIYNSCYSAKSYNGYGKIWYNIAPKSTPTTSITVQCTPDGQVVNKDFVFKDKPSFTKSKGFFLGTNTIEGPLSYGMGIEGNSEFTIVLKCSHDSFPNNSNFNIFTLFANTKNNIGLSLDVSDVNKSQVIQTGKLLLSFANDGTFSAKLKGIEEIPFDKKITYTYFITKTNTTLSLIMMSSIDNTINKVLTISNISTDMVFSNIPMVINKSGNWHGYIQAFAVYKKVLTDEEIMKIYEHLKNEDKKLDAVFLQKQSQVQELATQLKELQQCPFDKVTCDKCGKIKEWNDFSNILNTEKECLTTIDNYCSLNTTHQLCRCWDKKYEKYNSIACQNWRNIFKNKPSLTLDNLTKENLEQIKKKYQLLTATAIEKAIPGELKTLQMNVNSIKQNLISNQPPQPITEKTQPQPKKTFWEWLQGKT